MRGEARAAAALGRPRSRDQPDLDALNKYRFSKHDGPTPALARTRLSLFTFLARFAGLCVLRQHALTQFQEPSGVSAWTEPQHAPGPQKESCAVARAPHDSHFLHLSSLLPHTAPAGRCVSALLPFPGPQGRTLAKPAANGAGPSLLPPQGYAAEKPFSSQPNRLFPGKSSSPWAPARGSSACLSGTRTRPTGTACPASACPGRRTWRVRSHRP
jgi:hypothetical protein